MTHSPLVSIGMAVRNNEHTLRYCIQSLLLQTYAHWELLLMDDGSTDRTLEVARQFADPRIKVHASAAHRGQAAQLNAAIKLSRGDYFARIDGDDIAYPMRIERQLNYLESHTDIDLIGCSAIVFRQDGHAFGKRSMPETHSQICARPTAGFAMIHPSFFGRIAYFRRNLYLPTVEYCMDQDMLLRTYRTSRFGNVPEILLGYREDKIILRKTLTGRRYFSRSLFGEFKRQRRITLGLRGVAEQGVKSLVDIAAVSTGLQYLLLRHRARPITLAERQAWERVWAQVSSAVAVRA